MSSDRNDPPVDATATQVGVERRTNTAHLLLPMSHDIERFGISVCGFPAEYLIVVPDLTWSQVVPSQRCEHCEPTPAT